MKRTFLLVCFAVLLGPGPSRGGSGIYFHRTDGAPDELTLGVDLLVANDQRANWEPMFRAASRLLYDATEGQVMIAKVIFYKNCHGSQADIWIDNGSTAADSDTTGFGYMGTVISLSQIHQRVESQTRGDLGLVHELGHHLFALLDEYKDKNGSELTGASCIKVAGPTIDLRASIMDSGTKNIPRNQRTEFCVASNHNTGNTEQDKPRFIGSVSFENIYDWRWIQLRMQDRFGVTLKVPSGVPSSSQAGFGSDPDFVDGSCDLQTVVPIAKSGFSSLKVLEQDAPAFEILLPFPPVNASKALVREGADTFVRLLDQASVPGVVEVGKDAYALPFFGGSLDEKHQLLEHITGIDPNDRSGWVDLLKGALLTLSDYSDGPKAPAPVGNEAVLLLSDGWPGQAPGGSETVADLLSSLKQRGVVVHAVGLANDEVAGLRKIVAGTGGNYLFARTANEVNSAVMTLLAGMESRGIIEAREGRIAPQAKIDIPVLVDTATQDGRANVQLTWIGAGNELSLELRDPDGVLVTPGDGNIKEVDSPDQKARKIWIDRPKAGTWKISVSSASPVPDEFALQVQSATNGVTFAAYAEKSVVSSSDPVALKAVVRADHPVSGASVSAVIERPDGTRRTVVLYDGGALAHRDDRANDGVYSNTFSDYSGTGTYNVEVSVDSGLGVTVSPESRGGEFKSQPVDSFVRKARFSVVVQGVPR